MYAARLAIIILGMLSGAECPRIAKQIVSPYLQLLERTSMSKIVAVVSMSLDVLDRAPLTGVSRKLIEASAESRLRQALYAAGYRSVTRRPVVHSIVLDASV